MQLSPSYPESWQQVQISFISRRLICCKRNPLGSFHILNYSCRRQPEINVLEQK